MTKILIFLIKLKKILNILDTFQIRNHGNYFNANANFWLVTKFQMLFENPFQFN